MKKLIYITNIPTPYRQKRFNTMAKIFSEYEMDFEVLYMAKTEPDRQWIIPDDSFKYKYKIYKGIHPTIGRFFAHFNPGLLFRLLKNDYDIAVIGGMASPTHIIAPFLISSKKLKIMSIESNLFSVVRKKGLGAKIKSILLNNVDAYQITGEPQIDYIFHFQPKAKNKKIIHLPNLIDEDVFIKEVDALRYNQDLIRQSFGVFPDEQMWVIPAQLIPIKGIIPFLEAIKGFTGFKMFLLGDGEQKNDIKKIIKSNILPIKLTGFLQQDDVVKYYAAADLFILPSFKDPSPLSPIEACAAGLPILVSENIGNIKEVLNYKNGWSFEPGNVKEINKIVSSLLRNSRDELRRKGIESRKQYHRNFETENCVKNYALQLLEAFNCTTSYHV